MESLPVVRMRVQSRLVIITLLCMFLIAVLSFAHTPKQAHADASASATASNQIHAKHAYNAIIIAAITYTFGRYASQALAVAYCESGYNTFAYNRSSGASGVFQIVPGTWARTSRSWYSPFNAQANVAAAHEIFTRDGHSWREWVCQPW
jgi:Transglycosylase-like domain